MQSAHNVLVMLLTDKQTNIPNRQRKNNRQRYNLLVVDSHIHNKFHRESCFCILSMINDTL